jgi:hypothetical protein
MLVYANTTLAFTKPDASCLHDISQCVKNEFNTLERIHDRGIHEDYSFCLFKMSAAPSAAMMLIVTPNPGTSSSALTFVSSCGSTTSSEYTPSVHAPFPTVKPDVVEDHNVAFFP